jgi:prepilin-type processing-associated H-X9-DG protein
LLKNSQLALSLFSLSQAHDFQEIGKFDPAKDIAAAPPKVLVDRRISQAQLKQIGLAVFMYMQDYDEKMPPMVAARNANHLMYLPSSKTTSVPTVQNILYPYLKSTEVFLQPTTHRPYLPNYKVSRWPVSKLDNPSQTFLFFEDAPDIDGKRNVVFADGHVETLTESQFQWRRKEQGISESGYPSAAKPVYKAKVVPKA